jgi:hypothetical protein
VIPNLPTECVGFRKKTWMLELQIQGIEPFPASGVIRTTWLERHRNECDACNKWLNRVMAPYGVNMRKMLREALAGFGKMHGLSPKEIAWRLRLWHDDRRRLRTLSRGKKLEKYLKGFMQLAEISKDDFRHLLVDWLQENDPQ